MYFLISCSFLQCCMSTIVSAYIYEHVYSQTMNKPEIKASDERHKMPLEVVMPEYVEGPNPTFPAAAELELGGADTRVPVARASVVVTPPKDRPREEVLLLWLEDDEVTFRVHPSAVSGSER
jgi:hypothetical protein